MQVICPSCQSCFLLPPGVKTGTRLRCSVCRHEFSYTGPDVPAEPVQKAAAAPETGAMPFSAVTQPQPVQEQPSSDQPLNFEPAPVKDAVMPKSNPGDLPVLGGREKKGHGGLWLGLLILICLAGVAAWFTVPGFRSCVMQYQEQFFGEDSAKPDPDTKAESAGAAPQEEQPAAVRTDTLVFENTGNRYASNDHIGRLLIIEGRIKNTGDTAYGNIMLHAALLDKDRKVIDKADQVAGPVLTDFQLKVMTRAEMIKALSEEAGQNGSGVVSRDGTVPFMIIFCNPSDDLSEFSVKIGKADKVASDTAAAQPSMAAEPAEPVQPAAPAPDAPAPDTPAPEAPQVPAPSVPEPAVAPMAPASGQPQSVPQAVPPSVQPTVQ